MSATSISSTDFEKALKKGRPPNVVKLFPNSKALIVSGKFIDRAMLAKGKTMTMAANGRNNFVIRGALKAAQKANAAIIIENATAIPRTVIFGSAVCDGQFAAVVKNAAAVQYCFVCEEPAVVDSNRAAIIDATAIVRLITGEGTLGYNKLTIGRVPNASPKIECLVVREHGAGDR